MRVGILGGTGPAGRALAARLAAVGVEVLIGSRSPDRAQEMCDRITERWPGRSLPLIAADNPVAAEADIVVVATPWEAAAATASSVASQLEGKVVVSMGNAVARVGDQMQYLLPPTGSVAAGVQMAVPTALIAAAFHHLPARALGDLEAELDCDVLICSDHAVATKATAELVTLVPGLRALDAGGLASAGALEAFTAVLLQLNARYQTRAALRVTGIEPA